MTRPKRVKRNDRARGTRKLTRARVLAGSRAPHLQNLRKFCKFPVGKYFPLLTLSERHLFANSGGIWADLRRYLTQMG